MNSFVQKRSIVDDDITEASNTPQRKRVFSETSAKFYRDEPPKIPRLSASTAIASDYFMVSQNLYKARISKFVRNVQAGGDIGEKSIAVDKIDPHSSNKMQSFEKKSRFSFKRDGIYAVSNLIDIFCEGLFYELRTIVTEKRDNGQEQTIIAEDIETVLRKLGWADRVKLN